MEVAALVLACPVMVAAVPGVGYPAMAPQSCALCLFYLLCSWGATKQQSISVSICRHDANGITRSPLHSSGRVSAPNATSVKKRRSISCVGWSNSVITLYKSPAVSPVQSLSILSRFSLPGRVVALSRLLRPIQDRIGKSQADAPGLRRVEGRSHMLAQRHAVGEADRRHRRPLG